MGLTGEIGAFLGGLRPHDIPPGAIATVRVGFADCLAAMIAGWNEPAARIIAASLDSPTSGGVVLPFDLRRVRTPDAALAMAVAAHVLEFDDTGLAGHPSAVLVPAILAEARENGAAGDRMVAAYVAGYEIWAELVGRDQDQLHQKGWHPSAMYGAIAAAGAVSVLRGLDAPHSAAAVGVATSLAGGVVANFGSMTKPLQLARAAQSGLLAARLAEGGLTSSPDAIEHPTGFLRAVSPQGRVDTAARSHLGEDWRILRHGLNIKLYPVCYSTHRILDAMAALRQATPFAAAEVAAIEIEIGETQAAMLRNHLPQTGADAKFSGEFAMAAMVIAGRCGRGELTDAFVRRLDVQDLMRRVGTTTIAEKDPEEPAHSPFDRVHVTLRDGRQLASDPVTHAYGHFRRPVPTEGLWRKFQDCAADRLSPAVAREVFDAALRVEGLAGAAALLDPLRGSGAEAA